MIQPCGGTGMTLEAVGRQKNWFNTDTISAVSPRARYRCFTSRQGSRNHGATSRSLSKCPEQGFCLTAFHEKAGRESKLVLSFFWDKFYPAEPAPRAGKN